MSLAAKSLECSACTVGRYAVYGPVFADNAKLISDCRLSVKQFEARQVIVSGGKPLQSVMTLRDGWACRFKLLPDGRRHILSFLIPGDTVLFELLLAPKFTPPYSVKALTPVTACLFDLNDYRRIVTNSPAQTASFEDSIQQFCTAIHRRQVDLGRRSAMARIAQLVLEIEGRLSERQLTTPDGFDFPLGQRDMSDATGVTTAHVNRVLRQMREQGVLQLGRKKLRILDRQRLKDLGEGD